MRTALIPLLALPDFPLSEHEPLARGFLALGLRSFVDAAGYVWRLPYGRNSDRADFRLVLPEGRGTCSTRHALLAALARAHGQPVQLTLGIYEMHERNTPGVGAVLEREGLSGIPEAHCYLVVNQRRAGRFTLRVSRPRGRGGLGRPCGWPDGGEATNHRGGPMISGPVRRLLIEAPLGSRFPDRKDPP
jgi:hypothetical protein